MVNVAVEVYVPVSYDGLSATIQATVAASPAFAECEPVPLTAKLTTVTAAAVLAFCVPEHAVPDAAVQVNVSSVLATLGPLPANSVFCTVMDAVPVVLVLRSLNVRLVLPVKLVANVVPPPLLRVVVAVLT